MACKICVYFFLLPFNGPYYWYEYWVISFTSSFISKLQQAQMIKHQNATDTMYSVYEVRITYIFTNIQKKSKCGIKFQCNVRQSAILSHVWQYDKNSFNSQFHKYFIVIEILAS